jgi:hypothetical protein
MLILQTQLHDALPKRFVYQMYYTKCCLIRILSILFLSTSMFAQTPTGIYFVTKPAKRSLCEQSIKTYFGKTTLCISKKPIVGIEGIEYVSNIMYDPLTQVNYLDVGLSPASVSILNKVYQSMPGSQLAFVAQEKVLGRFTIDRKIVNRTMNIGRDLDLNQLKVLLEVLRQENFKKD